MNREYILKQLSHSIKSLNDDGATPLELRIVLGVLWAKLTLDDETTTPRQELYALSSTLVKMTNDKITQS